jgi:hypothetical protein
MIAAALERQSGKVAAMLFPVDGRRRTLAVIAVLVALVMFVLFAGLLPSRSEKVSFRYPTFDKRCVVASMSGSTEIGFARVPCLPVENGGFFFGVDDLERSNLFCDRALTMRAPGNDVASC